MIDVHCSALLFDLDGVLIDSTSAITRVWNRWAIEHGFDPEEVVRSAHGRPSLSTVRDHLPDANPELENHEVERREMEDLEGVVPLPGATTLLVNIPSGPGRRLYRGRGRASRHPRRQSRGRQSHCDSNIPGGLGIGRCRRRLDPR
jgi:beta-phosphoglucomutase-like phosphatase (HAD superfamily)